MDKRAVWVDYVRVPANTPKTAPAPAAAGKQDSAPWYLAPPSFYAAIVVGGIKGGIGKTTAAMHLALALATTGKRVLLVDADPASQSAFAWATKYAEIQGKAFPIQVVQYTQAQGMPQYLAKLMIEHEYAHMVIDVGGDSDVILRAALRAAAAWSMWVRDNVGAVGQEPVQARASMIMPVSPSGLDLVRIQPTMDTVRDVAAEVGPIFRWLVVSKPISPKQAQQCQETLIAAKLPVASTFVKQLGRYQCFPALPADPGAYGELLQEIVTGYGLPHVIETGYDEEVGA